MDTQQLSYFLVLCDTLNYTSAAERCFITRQAMRQSVQALEAAYGMPLVENVKNRLHLTPGGLMLREMAKPVVAAYEALEATMRGCRSAELPLCVGMSRSILPFYAPELGKQIDAFGQSCPGLPLDIRMMTADEVIDGLLCGALDAGFVVCDGAIPFPFRRIVLREDPMTVILSANHPLAGKASLTLQDLNGLPFNLMSRPENCFPALLTAFKAARSFPEFTVVPEYFDVGVNIRDNRTVGMDRMDAEVPPQMGSGRNCTLENGRFTLQLSLLLPENAPPAAQMLAAFLGGKA